MATFVTDCAICNRPITESTPFLSTSGCAFPETHPLWKYCDTGLHQACLVDWERRREFSAAYCFIGSPAHLLLENATWVLGCGPLGYGPYGKARLPHYAEIRLSEWPVRLYSRFDEWDGYMQTRPWEEENISLLNEYISAVFDDFPKSTEALKALLLPRVIAMIEHGLDHGTRYVAILALSLFGEKARIAAPIVENALGDDHGSVRQAAHMLLKKWKAASKA